VRPAGLSEAEFRLLWLLAKPCNSEPNSHPPDQAALASELSVSPAQVSGLVERLSAHGLIESGPISGDRRRQSWRLSLAGYQAIARVMAVVTAVAIPPVAPPFKGGESDAEAAA
jgi:DNA-binding MarR family transcriptional regulator